MLSGMRTVRLIAQIISLVLVLEIIFPIEIQASRNLTRSPMKSEIKEPMPAEKYLLSNNLQKSEEALLIDLQRHSSDDNLRFTLGLLQFVRAVEQLGQDLYRFGVQTTNARFIPILRLPVPKNPSPETITYQGLRDVVRRFATNLQKTEGTLGKIKDPDVQLPVHFGLIRLDLNADGIASEEESLWSIFSELNGRRTITLEDAERFYIKFDRGDVHWLRGYCHLILAMSDFYLAHDASETFARSAHLFFEKTDSPYQPLLECARDGDRRDVGSLFDFVALVHTIRWPVVDRERMASSLLHLQTVTSESKESWKWIMMETTDDHEWLPNPNQHSVIPNARVTHEMVLAWQQFMDQIAKVLTGELLVPFWRGDTKYGVNVRKAFLEPQTFDLVLWVQGSAAVPYLQSGNKTDQLTWQRLQDAFGGQLLGFAVWFN